MIESGLMNPEEAKKDLDRVRSEQARTLGRTSSMSFKAGLGLCLVVVISMFAYEQTWFSGHAVPFLILPLLPLGVLVLKYFHRDRLRIVWSNHRAELLALLYGFSAVGVGVMTWWMAEAMEIAFPRTLGAVAYSGLVLLFRPFMNRRLAVLRMSWEGRRS
jgi:hypothetical protein